MSKAFALKDFDTQRILQRRFFKDFQFDADKTDEEILHSLTATDSDSFETTEKKQVSLDKLINRLAVYAVHLERHKKRLDKYIRAIEQKSISDETANIASLRVNYQRAKDLLLTYWGHVTVSSPTDEKIVIYQTSTPIINFVKGLYVQTKELEKNERMYYRKVFAERLKTARRAAGLLQADLGEELGLTRRNISDYETLRYEPSLAALVKIARKLKKPVGWFLGVD